MGQNELLVLAERQLRKSRETEAVVYALQSVACSLLYLAKAIGSEVYNDSSSGAG